MIKELRNKYKNEFGKELGYNSPEFNRVDLDTIVLSDLVITLIEEVKGLREDLKVKVETIKASAEPIKPVAEEKPKAPAKK